MTQPHIIITGDASGPLLVDILSRVTSTPIADNTHRLRFDTKYYIADVDCYHAIDSIPSAIADSIEAVVVHFDGQSTTTLDAWIGRIDALSTSVEIRLAVCDRLYDVSSIRPLCLRHSFELIECDPDEETRDELAECRELFGVERVMQALRTHQWPNAVMKDDPMSAVENLDRLREWIEKAPDSSKSRSFDIDDEHITALGDKLAAESITTSDASACATTTCVETKSRSILDAMHLDATITKAFADVDDGRVDFEQLFSQFATMKEIACTLTGDQRRKHAEKVTIAFWKAIGGDQDELADIVDSDDENV